MQGRLLKALSGHRAHLRGCCTCRFCHTQAVLSSTAIGHPLDMSA
jgi:hypothetical protein